MIRLADGRRRSRRPARGPSPRRARGAGRRASTRRTPRGRSTIVSATSRSTRSMNIVRATASRVVVRVLGRIHLRVGHRPDHVDDRRRERPERRDGPLARLGVAGDDACSAMTTSLPWCSSGTNGIGGQGMTFAIVDSSSGAASAAAMNPAIVSGVAGRISIPPTTLGDVVRAGTGTGSRRRSCRRRRGSPRTGPGRCSASTRSSSPSAVTISAASSVVDRQAVLAHEVADPAAERDPADPDRAGVAEADREAVGADRGRCTRPRSARSRPRRSARRRRSRSPFMSRRSRTMPPSVALWPAPLWPPLRTASSSAGLAGERDDRGDVVGVGDPDDDRRPAVELRRT